MKIRFKINKRQLMIWGGFLETTKHQQDDKLIKLLIESLVLRLKKQVIIDQVKYSFSIPTTEGLAFVQHTKNVSINEIPEVDHIVINNIIGIIDQKTK